MYRQDSFSGFSDGSCLLTPVRPQTLTFRGDDAPFRPPELRRLRPVIQDEPTMHAYRSHSCGALRLADAGSNVRLSGWVHRKRDHGGLLFIDLRDHYGLTQLVLHPETPGFEAVERLREPRGQGHCRAFDGLAGSKSDVTLAEP